MTDTSKFKYVHNMLNGYMVPDDIFQETYDSVYSRFPFKDGDVVISTYPKSGTTFTQYVVHYLLKGDLKDGENIASACPWHEKCTFPDSVKDEQYRVWKSHLCWKDTFKPTDVNVKYIYVARNIKDVAVSMFHHARGFKSFEYDGDWEDWVVRFKEGNVEFGEWKQHVLDWYIASKKHNNILYLFYEDFINDPKTFIKSIASFLNVELTNERLNEICDKTNFDNMKSNDKTNYSFTDRHKDRPPFMRKGKVGDWINYFTDQQSAEYDAICNSIIATTDLQFTFSL